MWDSIANWIYTNAAAIFISALASLLISKHYFDKANRDGVLSTIIFPIVRILEKRFTETFCIMIFLQNIITWRIMCMM